MTLVSGGSFEMGSNDFYPEEQPVTARQVGDLLVDVHPVTNAEFRRFVKDTEWVTVAERTPAATDFPDASPEQLVPGSQVFAPTAGPVPLDDWRRWWRWQPGADWRHPEGPKSTLHGLERHPVVHVGWEDACAYAEWVGKRLPTEPEWEHAARGGLQQKTYPWGDEFLRHGREVANTWQGGFPYRRPRLFDGAGTSPVETFPPNGYGLFDVAGNVWEWTSTEWTPDHATGPGQPPRHACCGPRTVSEDDRRVMKGGSHLCAPEYCHRYRPAARQGQGVRSSTNHIGFRCVRDP
ncbi:MAG: formylglycine-generating enzyme family protein [Frankiaceae bacterium]